MRLATFICFVFMQNMIFVANITAQKSELNKANIFFEAGKYDLALVAYNNYNRTEKKPNLLIKRGICYLNTNQPDLCIRDMIKAGKLNSNDDSRYKYIADAKMSKAEYVEAAKYYKIYLAKTLQDASEWQHIVNQIKKCGYARNGKYYPQKAFVENMGSKVNTKNDEYSPKQSPTNLFRYYFSSSRPGSDGGLMNKQGNVDSVKGKYTSDIYYTDLINGNWSSVQRMGPNINSPSHEIIQGFSNDGKILYYVTVPMNAPAYLYTDTFAIDKGFDKDFIPIINMPFKPELGDRNLHLFNDSLIVFAAKRELGYGGYDLYYATKSEGFWSDAINMGPEVNSSFDEVAPYLTKDGNTIYFSSDRNDGYGGFDVFLSEYEDYRWKTPENLGLPINSPGDDLDFQISTDGTMAVMASNRISSFGRMDLFICYFKDQLLNQFDITDVPVFVHNAILSQQELESLQLKSTNAIAENTPKKEIIIRPITFNEDEDISNPINLAYLKQLVNAIAIYPNIKVVIQSHTTMTGKPDMELFFSLKRAELVVAQLVRYGIKRNNIILQGYGANYPMAQNYINNTPNKAAETINKRIDIRLVLNENEPLKIKYEWPLVHESQMDTKWMSLQAMYDNSVVFKVKFAETTQMLKSDIISSDNSVIVEKYPESDRNVYSFGIYHNWQEAYLAKSKLISHNVFGAEVVPYLNGIRMTSEQVQANKGKFTQLDLYINFNK